MINVTPRKKEIWMYAGATVIIEGKKVTIQSMDVIENTGTNYILKVWCNTALGRKQFHPDDISELKVSLSGFAASLSEMANKHKSGI